MQRRAEAPLTVLRDGRESCLSVRASEVATDSTQHLVMWCGLILQQACMVRVRVRVKVRVRVRVRVRIRARVRG